MTGIDGRRTDGGVYRSSGDKRASGRDASGVLDRRQFSSVIG